MSETIIFFGNERLATGVSTNAPTLQLLIDAGYNIAAVVSNFEIGQSRNARNLEIAQVAEKNNIPVLLPSKPIDIKKQLEECKASIAILVAYGRIVSQEVIDIFPKGIVNIHPSLLPLHRGPTPIESVILDGAETTGVSLMQLAKAMDAGPVFGQSEVALDGTETKQELADKLLEIGGSMLLELLPGIIDGTVVGVPQDDSRATYDRLITKADGVIDWSKSAAQIAKEVRAYNVWPKSSTKIADKDVIITATHLVESRIENRKQIVGAAFVNEQKQLCAQTGNGVLIIDKLKPAGKNEMTGQEFLAGHKI